MRNLAIWAQLESKPDRESDVEQFLKSAQPLAEREAGTISWYAIKMGPGKYGIFDTFADENGRNAHLNGEIAKALFARVEDLFAKPPEIAKPEILASKIPQLSRCSSRERRAHMKFHRRVGLQTRPDEFLAVAPWFQAVCDQVAAHTSFRISRPTPKQVWVIRSA